MSRALYLGGVMTINDASRAFFSLSVQSFAHRLCRSLYHNYCEITVFSTATVSSD